MTSVVERRSQNPDSVFFACDFSPPRGADPKLLSPALSLTADFISVAYNPGRSVRINSVLAADWIQQKTRSDVIFSLSTRDINKIGLQSLLLGAQLARLKNVVIVKGDNLSSSELSMTKSVHDFKPTELLSSIVAMNKGLDYKGKKLQASADFCIGATIDLNNCMEREITLTYHKVQAGAQFFLMQPVSNPNVVHSFMDYYKNRYGKQLTSMLFVGVQMVAPGGLTFGQLPEWITKDLDAGRPSHDIAVQAISELLDTGFRSIYLIPPVFKGGRRGYDDAKKVLNEFKSLPGK